MKTGGKNLLFVLFLFAVVGTLYALSLRGTPRPRIPADERHPRPLVLERCRDCHAPGKDAPLPAQHPPKDQCVSCHRPKAVRK